MFLILQALKQACCVTYATSYLLWHIENTIFNGNWLKRLINMKWVITSPQFSLQMSVCFYCTSARRIKTTCKNPTGYVIWDFRVFELWPAIKALLKLTFKIQWHNPPKKRVSILCYVCFNNSRDSFGNKCSWEPLDTLGRGNRMDFDADCQTEWYVCGLRLDSYILYLKGIKMHRWCLRAWFGNRRGKTHHFVQVKKQKDRCDVLWTRSQDICVVFTSFHRQKLNVYVPLWQLLLLQARGAPVEECEQFCWKQSSKKTSHRHQHVISFV